MRRKSKRHGSTSDVFVGDLIRTIEMKRRASGNATEARASIARETRVAPGTLENLRRGRLREGLREEAKERLLNFAIREFEQTQQEAGAALERARRLLKER